MDIDLVSYPRHDPPKICEYSKRRCGVVCTSCNWRGYRTVGFKTRVQQRITPEDSFQLKGKQSDPWCPNCHSRSVVFTHICL